MRAVLILLVVGACGRIDFDATATIDAEIPCTPAVEVSALTSGNDFSCAVLTDGSARCWGRGDVGQLGAGDLASSGVPVTPSTLDANVTMLAGNRDHMCAAANGNAYCWGRNDAGQVGVGDRVGRQKPAMVLAGDVVGVAAGGLNSCAWTSTGALSCWGQADGTTGTDDSPVTVTGIPGVKTVALSAYPSILSENWGCALDMTGGLWCWGENTGGVLGSVMQSETPIAVTQPVPFADLAGGGGNICARTSDGDVYCWGANAYGQLGLDSLTDQSEPTQVALHGVAQISANRETSCAVTTAGEVYCWGANADGLLGAEGPNALAPQLVPLPLPARQISVGASHACALLSDGVVTCWGRDRSAVRGVAPTGRAVNVLGFGGGATAVDSGSDATCALDQTGLVRCWGAGHAGQIGDGTQDDHAEPVAVAGVMGTSISVGRTHTCATTTTGGISCWGNNSAGQVLGPGASSYLSPQSVGGALPFFDRVSAAGQMTFAFTSGAVPWSWGDSDEGATARTPAGHLAPGASDYPAFTDMATGPGFSCGYTGAGDLYCTGRGNEGQIGDGTSNDVFSPEMVLSAVNAVAQGAVFTCAGTATDVRCWGDNVHHQLGDNSDTRRFTPNAVVGLGSIKQIAAGEEHVCAVTGQNDVYCWGSNASGQLGDGTLMSRTQPTLSPELTAAAKLAGPGQVVISAGTSHTCLLAPDGSIRCVGANDRGQLGNGATVEPLAPRPSPLTCPR